MAAHRLARQPVRITKTVGALAAAGVAGIGLVVFSLAHMNSAGQTPASKVGTAVVITPSPEAAIPPTIPASAAPMASPTSTATADARAQTTIDKAAAHASPRPAITVAKHPITAETDALRVAVTHPNDQPTAHDFGDADPDASIPPSPSPSTSVAPPTSDPSSPAPTQTPTSASDSPISRHN